VSTVPICNYNTINSLRVQGASSGAGDNLSPRMNTDPTYRETDSESAQSTTEDTCSTSTTSKHEHMGTGYGRCKAARTQVQSSVIVLNTWLKASYGTSTLYLQDVWDKLITKLSARLTDPTDLGHTDTYILPLPKNLCDPKLIPYHFHADSSPVMTYGLDDRTTFELLGALVDQLNSNFGSYAHSADLVCGALAELQGPQNNNPQQKSIRIIILGGSHCRRSIEFYVDKGHKVVDLTKPGWLPTDTNIAEALVEIEKLGDLSDSVAILDLISNVAFRGRGKYRPY
jgi:hypothetical protein